MPDQLGGPFKSHIYFIFILSSSTTETVLENLVGSLAASIRYNSKLQKITEIIIKKAEISFVLSSQKKQISQAVRNFQKQVLV